MGDEEGGGGEKLNKKKKKNKEEENREKGRPSSTFMVSIDPLPSSSSPLPPVPCKGVAISGANSQRDAAMFLARSWLSNLLANVTLSVWYDFSSIPFGMVRPVYLGDDSGEGKDVMGVTTATRAATTMSSTSTSTSTLTSRTTMSKREINMMELSGNESSSWPHRPLHAFCAAHKLLKALWVVDSSSDERDDDNDDDDDDDEREDLHQNNNNKSSGRRRPLPLLGRCSARILGGNQRKRTDRPWWWPLPSTQPLTSDDIYVLMFGDHHPVTTTTTSTPRERRRRVMVGWIAGLGREYGPEGLSRRNTTVGITWSEKRGATTVSFALNNNVSLSSAPRIFYLQQEDNDNDNKTEGTAQQELIMRVVGEENIFCETRRLASVIVENNEAAAVQEKRGEERTRPPPPSPPILIAVE